MTKKRSIYLTLCLEDNPENEVALYELAFVLNLRTLSGQHRLLQEVHRYAALFISLHGTTLEMYITE